MANSLFIAIGVSNAAGMPKLFGVQEGVDDLSLWARSNGYDVIAIDDRRRVVSVDRIREQLTPPDGQGGTIPDLLLDRPRIVVYFCGHGLSFWPDQYWVLSAGPQFTRQRISANAFRDTLATYGPGQIAMISDACRTTQHLIGSADPVVDPYPGTSASAEKDRFYSSRDGTASFSMPASNGNPAYCVFSSVLIRALSRPDGLNLDRAYLRSGRMVVSSRSLSEYLNEHVVRAALAANQLQESQCEPGFGIDRDSYVEFASSPPTPVSKDGAVSTERPLPALVLNPETAEESAARRRIDQVDRIQRSRSEWRAPLRRTINEAVREEWQHDYGSFGPLIVSGFPWPDVDVAGAFRRDWRFERDLGSRHSTWFSLDRARELSTPILVRSRDRYTVVPMFSDLWCSIIFDRPNDENVTDFGVEMLAWGNLYGVLERDDSGTLDPSEALKGLTNGTLVSEDIGVLAHRMRQGKHADPMLGIVSAYLYNSVGDINSIRRMCYYYQWHNQDVPFDIAMLTGLRLQSTDAGDFVLEVPEVQEDLAGRSRGWAEYTWNATPSVTVGVAGVTPVARAGWPHLRSSPHRVHRECWELIDNLAQSPVSTFLGRETGIRLAEIFVPWG